MDLITIMRIVLAIVTIITTFIIVKDCMGHKDEIKGTTGQFIALALIGFWTNFFDTWGIGSFAPTQAAFKFTKTSPDETVPGTLNVGDTLPVSVEALLFLGFSDIDPMTLLLMLAASCAGAFIGAGIVSKWNLKTIRYVMATFLVICAIVTVMRTMGVGPFGVAGEAVKLTGIKLILGVVGNFFLGAFMMVGLGLYSPCIALVAMLGLNVGTAFPIMMGSCAFLMNVSVFKFVKEGKYDRRATLMLMFPGALGAFAAYKIACFFSLTTLTYIVCVVMLITATMYVMDAKKSA
jgi:uncharacterized membrane protein YfcA